MHKATQEPKTKSCNPPKWFTIAAALALVWNLIGVLAFIGQIMMSPEVLAELSQAEQDIYLSTPLWATTAFACAVVGGLLGSFALLMKKPLAQPLLILSLLAVIIQMFHSFVISNALEVFGPDRVIMPVMVIIIAITLVYLSKKAKTNGWLN